MRRNRLVRWLAVVAVIFAAISACELMTDPKLRADGIAFLADVRSQMPVGSRTLDQIDRAAAALRAE